MKPADEPPVEELALSAQYGPETNTVLVKADILDLPGREKVATAEAKVLEPETGKVLGSVPMRPFREWYGGAELQLKDVAIPVQDFRKAGAGKTPATPGQESASGRRPPGQGRQGVEVGHQAARIGPLCRGVDEQQRGHFGQGDSALDPGAR